MSMHVELYEMFMGKFREELEFRKETERTWFTIPVLSEKFIEEHGRLTARVVHSSLIYLAWKHHLEEPELAEEIQEAIEELEDTYVL